MVPCLDRHAKDRESLLARVCSPCLRVIRDLAQPPQKQSAHGLNKESL